jgi:hypothetical protein
MNTHAITRWLNRLGLAVVLLAGMIIPQRAAAENNMGVSFQVFYDELSPYGDWVKDARYGYIWLPAVRNDFHPYGSQGHWVMTEYGNTWVSEYDWGWAPFHYGRWYFDDYFQSWAWIPGYEWGPAWVNWRSGGGYYGWAPLGPGVSINVNVGIPSFHWVFIPNRHIHHQYAYRYYTPSKNKVKIYNNTTIINNTVVYNNHNYIGGPQRREVEKVTRRVVPVYKVQSSNAPGRAAVSRNEVNIYRPQVQESRERTVEARPSRVLDAEATKTARSSRVVDAATPSRNGSTQSSTGTRAVQPSTNEAQNSARPATTQTPSRTVSPSGKEENKKPTVTPMPAQNQNRNTTTSPSRSQSTGTRQATPSRSSEVKNEGTRTQQSAPSRGTVQQAKPAQTPSRTQAPAVKRSEPAKSKVAQPARTQSSRPSTQVRTSAPANKSVPASSRTSSGSSRSGSGRNN